MRAHEGHLFVDAVGESRQCGALRTLASPRTSVTTKWPQGRARQRRQVDAYCGCGGQWPTAGSATGAGDCLVAAL